MTEPTAKKSFFNDLWERRFFQFFATYVAASWGSIQALEWAVRRYDMPSAWVDKWALFLLILLPMIASLIYFHGRPGDDKWFKFERIFYPINTIAALVMSVFLVQGSAGVTEKVSITNEVGETEVRIVPKKEHNESVVIFPTEIQNENAEWKGIIIGELVQRELEQDMRIMAEGPLSIVEKSEHYGYKKFQNLPFAAKLNIAQDIHSNFFVASEYIDKEKGQVEVKVYNTNSGDVVAEEIIENTDLYSLAENISETVNKQIKLSEVEGKELYIDYPASNLITADTAALRIFTEAYMLLINNPKALDQVAEKLKKTLEKDPTCVECSVLLARINLAMGKDGKIDMGKAMKYVNNLPERQQLDVKFTNYLVDNDIEKASKLCKMWKKLYPVDKKPVNREISLYKMTLRLQEAKEVAKEAIANDHKGSIYLTYADLAIQTKDWDEAEKYLKIYKEEYPKKEEATELLVDVYKGKGEIDKATEALDELMMMNPSDKQLIIKKANLFSNQNECDKAITSLNKSLAIAEIPTDKIANYNSQLKVYSRAMRFKEYASTRRKLAGVFNKNFPPIAYLQTRLMTMSYLNDIGQQDSMKLELQDMENSLTPVQKTAMGGMLKFMADIATKNLAEVEDSYEKVKPMLANMGNNSVFLAYDAEIAYFKGDYDTAIKNYTEYVPQMNGNFDMISSNYYESYLDGKKYAEGLKTINELLIFDQKHPILNYFKAEYLHQLGKDKEATTVLKEIMPVFKASDQRYKYTKRVNALAQELGI